MKRIYYSDRRRKLTQEALLQLRRTRQLIDPALLAEVRQIIARQAAPRQSAQAQTGPETIDRQKNMLTVLKFLELKAGNEALRRKVQDIIQ
jgi:hypothetical protein